MKQSISKMEKSVCSCRVVLSGCFSSDGSNDKPVLQNNCNSIFTWALADLADAHVILAKRFVMESGAYRTLLETVNRKSTVCGPSYDYPGDEDLVQHKDYKGCEKKNYKCKLTLFLFVSQQCLIFCEKIFP